ncbi:MAG: hypothetical protein ACE5I5_19725 [Candidatus Heimdallarchaeota archaeon]
MASGDAQRAWFPEMLDALRERWHENITWEEVSLFCDEMQKMRDRIRESRNIKPVKIFCKECGEYSLSTPPRISIRSLLFALKKSGIVSEEQFKELDKNWKKYRKEIKVKDGL